VKKLVRITTVPVSLDKLLGNQLHFMNEHYEVTAVSSDRESLRKIADKYGIGHHHIEMTRKITPFKDLKSFWQVYRFLRTHRPEIVHTHTPKAGLIGMAAAFFAGVPVRMHTVAGLPLLQAKGLKKQVLKIAERTTYSFANGVYPNSFNMEKIIEDYGFCSAGKLKVIGNGSSNGIDLQHFDPEQYPEEEVKKIKTSLGITENDFTFVFVGRLVKDKGINELVSAFSALSKKYKGPFKLLLVGNYEEKLDPLLPETLKEIAQNPNIISTGFREDVRPYFAVSDALAFPSYREGFPNVVLQAAAMNLPCIVTNINGCNEIVADGVNGLLMPVKDEIALEQAMYRLYSDHSLYAKLQSNARNSIEGRFTQTLLWSQIREEYDRRWLLSTPSSSRTKRLTRIIIEKASAFLS